MFSQFAKNMFSRSVVGSSILFGGACTYDWKTLKPIAKFANISKANQNSEPNQNSEQFLLNEKPQVSKPMTSKFKTIKPNIVQYKCSNKNETRQSTEYHHNGRLKSIDNHQTCNRIVWDDRGRLIETSMYNDNLVKIHEILYDPITKNPILTTIWYENGMLKSQSDSNNNLLVLKDHKGQNLLLDDGETVAWVKLENSIYAKVKVMNDSRRFIIENSMGDCHPDLKIYVEFAIIEEFYHNFKNSKYKIGDRLENIIVYKTLDLCLQSTSFQASGSRIPRRSLSQNF
jgi:hypothetical protein